MPAKLSAFVIWVLVAAGAVFWGYRLGAKPLAAPPNVQTIGDNGPARGDLTRLLGAVAVPAVAAAAPVAESSRFRLLGVLAPAPPSDPAKMSATGVALIAVDGKPARAYAVGARLDAELVLLSVARRSASIGPAGGAPSLVLDLPPPTAPATGTLPRAMADGDSARPMPGPPMTAPSQQQPPPMAQAQGQAAQPADESDDEEEVVTPPRRGGGVNPPASR